MKRHPIPVVGGLSHPRWAVGGNLVISCGDHTDHVPGTLAASFQLCNNPRRTRSPAGKVRLREVECLVHSHTRHNPACSLDCAPHGLCGQPAQLCPAVTLLPVLLPCPPQVPPAPGPPLGASGLHCHLPRSLPQPPVQSSLHACLHPSRLGSPALSTAAQGSYHQRTHSTSGACLSRTRVPRREGALPRKGAANTGRVGPGVETVQVHAMDTDSSGSGSVLYAEGPQT